MVKREAPMTTRAAHWCVLLSPQKERWTCSPGCPLCPAPSRSGVKSAGVDNLNDRARCACGDVSRKVYILPGTSGGKAYVRRIDEPEEPVSAER